MYELQSPPAPDVAFWQISSFWSLMRAGPEGSHVLAGACLEQAGVKGSFAVLLQLLIRWVCSKERQGTGFSKLDENFWES